MRRLTVAGLLMLAMGLRASAQSRPVQAYPAQAMKLRDDPALEPLRRGGLLVWLISHQEKPILKADTLPTASAEQTAGSFGQTSSSVGQTAGSTGQTAGGFGQTSSSLGRTSSSTGQTAGSFGVSTSDLARASADAHRTDRAPAPLRRDASWDRADYRGSFFERELFSRIRFVDIGDGELAEKLAATEGTDDAPDVLLGNPLPEVWNGDGLGGGTALARRYGATMLGDGVHVVQMEHGQLYRVHLQAAILLKARHPAAAGAYVTWLRDGDVCLGCWVRTPETDGPVDAAKRVLSDVLNGQSPGADADPEMVKFDARKVALGALGLAEPLDLSLDIAVSAVEKNDRLALVKLRGIVYNASAFGVVHALAVLRPDAAGRWRVLHLTPNLDMELIAGAGDMLSPYASARPVNTVAIGTERPGVSLAAPVDGDVRPPRPELWWDNAGGATLQVVEWQVCDRGCTDSNLYFVPDAEVRLHTRVVALFAGTPGQYRWRVWSLAPGGAMALSAWRTLNILAQ